MNIDWLTKQDNNGAITIYNNNITLNKQAANYFENAYCVAVGINKDDNNIVIKYVTKEEYTSSSAESAYYKIAIKNSYGRITGKQMVDKIAAILNLNFDSVQAYKFPAKWNTGYKMLIVNTKKGGE